MPILCFAHVVLCIAYGKKQMKGTKGFPLLSMTWACETLAAHQQGDHGASYAWMEVGP